MKYNDNYVKNDQSALAEDVGFVCDTLSVYKYKEESLIL